MTVQDVHLRPAHAQDFAQVLALNQASVQFLSPLDDARLAWLHGQAAYHRVLEQGGTVQAFLLAFREGADYDSPNYRWFAARYPQFLYIDRVVVAASLQGSGAGHMLYNDLLAFARANHIATVCCEIDSDPPNPVSQRFHKRYGFVPVGSQVYGSANKEVSLQVLDLSMG